MLLVAILMGPVPLSAQTPKTAPTKIPTPIVTPKTTPATTTTYTIYSYMKVADGKNEEYLKLEQAWKKIHTAKRKAGKILDWGLLRVLLPGGAESEYNYITRIVLNVDQMDGYLTEPYLPANWEMLMYADQVDLVKRTNEIRTWVKDEVWSFVDVVQPPEDTSKVIKPAVKMKEPISVFNFFKVPEGKRQSDFIKMETDIWKPIHAARIKDGQMELWALLQQEIPFGSSLSYEMATIDQYKDMKTYLSPVFSDYFKKVHPTKKIADLMKQTDAVSNLVKADIRIRVDYLDPEKK